MYVYNTHIHMFRERERERERDLGRGERLCSLVEEDKVSGSGGRRFDSRCQGEALV